MTDEAIVRQLTRSALARLVEKTMREQSLSVANAIEEVYSSRLYRLVTDPNIGLYREGPDYLYEMLCEEKSAKP